MPILSGAASLASPPSHLWNLPLPPPRGGCMLEAKPIAVGCCNRFAKEAGGRDSLARPCFSLPDLARIKHLLLVYWNATVHKFKERSITG